MSFLVALVLGIVVLVVALKLALGLIALLLGLGVAVIAYFGAEKLVGKGR